jgi:hypothetical protein
MLFQEDRVGEIVAISEMEADEEWILKRRRKTEECQGRRTKGEEDRTGE